MKYGPGVISLESAPALPPWLAAELPFNRRVARLSAGRVHFVDHGEGRPVLLLHGNPTWSFLWRKVITHLPEGLRVIAPDLLGLGLSEKLPRPEDHTLELHVGAVRELVDALDLRRVTLVGQDWGGPIGAGVAAREPDRFAGIVFANTTVLEPRRPLRTTWFHTFGRMPILSTLAFRGLNFPVPILPFAQGRRRMDAIARRAYAYPLRRWRDRAGPLGLARMVPSYDDHPSLPLLEEGARWARGFRGPVELVWGMRDPILGRALRRLRELWPQARVTETDAGHFLQEEVPKELAEAIARVAAP